MYVHIHHFFSAYIAVLAYKIASLKKNRGTQYAVLHLTYSEIFYAKVKTVLYEINPS